jgi:hypothetical protein
MPLLTYSRGAIPHAIASNKLPKAVIVNLNVIVSIAGQAGFVKADYAILSLELSFVPQIPDFQVIPLDFKGFCG